MTIAHMQAAADLLDRSGIGYDQNERWSFLDLATRSIIAGGETDCSASCGAIIWLGGYPIDLKGTFYTGNFAEKAKAAGFSVIRFQSLDQVLPGDFLLTPGAHVVFVRDRQRFWSAESDERGQSTGGQAGDQTGRETRYRAPYVRSGGWTYIVRPPAEAAPLVTQTGGWTHRVAFTNVLNVRRGPGTTHGIITTVTRGARLRLLGDYSRSWVKVRFEGGTEGWVHNAYINRVETGTPA